jgi:hypothetical protein
VVRLGAWLPFEQVPAALAFFAGVHVDADTARRLTEQAGAALAAVESAAAERLTRDWAAPPAGPAVQQLSVDGAMVPLVHGEWAEVKTMAVGTVTAAPGAGAEPPAVHTGGLSYFSRLADAEQFCELAGPELWRRGIATAGTVCAVMDGAEWLQHFVDAHAPDAVRILDFAHAAEHLSAAAHAVWGSGTAATSEWLGRWLHELKHGDPDAVLTAVRALPVTAAAQPAEVAATRDGVVQYLEKRRAQLAYAHFQAQGYPIGSGIVESANKLVVEARLKGSGMRWARANVNSLLALRGAACSDRWAAVWPTLWQERRRQTRQHRQAGRLRRHPPLPPAAPAPPEALPPLALQPSRFAPRPPRMVNGHPTLDHPWKQPLLRRPRPDTNEPAKT